MGDPVSELEGYRGLREAVEASILPLATSVDGRRFEFQASLHGLELEAGGYVALDPSGRTRLGQLLSLEIHQQQAGALDRPGHILIRVAAATASSSPAAGVRSTTRWSAGPHRPR